MAITNIRTEYFTVTDFAELTGLTRNGIYHKVGNQSLQKNRDYKLLSDNKKVFVINRYTILLVKKEYRDKLTFKDTP